jgi:hypothetical protein
MKRIVRPGIFFWIFVAALAPLDEGRGDNCFERCASALGGQDAVSASIYDNCLNSCRTGASQQESVRFAALAMSLATLRSGSSHGQNSESDAQQLALKNCATVASDCKLVNWGYNLCFALATSQPDGRYGRGVDSDRARAVNQALGLCRGAGGKNCIAQASPCANDDPRWPSPAASAGQTGGVDPHTIGLWELSLKGGRWVWEISRDGTYKFHSEATDGVESHAGTFSASAGRWSLRATNGYTDEGTYIFQPPDTLIATGHLGTAAWRHRADAAHH